MKINYVTDPWECVEIEDFLPEDRWKEIQGLAKIELDEYHSSNTKEKSGHYVKFLDYDIIPDAKKLTPAYVVFDNYELILKWNRSLRFALAVCTLKSKFKNAI